MRALGDGISRDPIEERGGKNLYAAVANDLVCKCDYLGLAECDCCVDALWISSVEEYNNDSDGAARTGHKFTLAIGVEYSPSSNGKAKDCKLSWKETWDAGGYTPSGKKITPGETFDVYQDSPSAFEKWNNRKKHCCTGELIEISDVPNITRGWISGATGELIPVDNHRILKFEITVESGSSSCPTKSLTVKATQVLEVKGGVLQVPPSGFSID